MLKTKRNYWWIFVPCFQLSLVAILAYNVSREILERYSLYWLILLAILVLLAVAVVYRHFRSSIRGKIMRNEPIVFDRSNEIPYEFDNPYMSKQTQEARVIEDEDRE